jgi:peptide/nickel transport system permease protein
VPRDRGIGHTMTQYVTRRLLLLIPTVLLVSLLAFSILRLIPGDAVIHLLGEQGYSPQTVAKLRKEFGLDKPIYEQYGIWMKDLGQGNFGTSITSGEPVTKILVRTAPVTIELAAFAVSFAAIISLPIGIVSAVKRDTFIDYTLRSIAIGALSIPGFWIATLVIVLSAHWWGWIPPIGYKAFLKAPVQNVQILLLPAIILAISLAAPSMRMTRSMMLEVLRQDYIRTARAKGLSPLSVITKHALRNALIPVVTIMGVQVAFALGGSVIMERIFVLPGLGNLMYTSVARRDYPIVQAVNLVFAVAILLINLFVDLIYTYLNPRIRFGS